MTTPTSIVLCASLFSICSTLSHAGGRLRVDEFSTRGIYQLEERAAKARVMRAHEFARVSCAEYLDQKAGRPFSPEESLALLSRNQELTRSQIQGIQKWSRHEEYARMQLAVIDGFARGIVGALNSLSSSEEMNAKLRDIFSGGDGHSNRRNKLFQDAVLQILRQSFPADTVEQLGNERNVPYNAYIGPLAYPKGEFYRAAILHDRVLNSLIFSAVHAVFEGLTDLVNKIGYPFNVHEHQPDPARQKLVRAIKMEMKSQAKDLLHIYPNAASLLAIIEALRN